MQIAMVKDPEAYTEEPRQEKVPEDLPGPP